MTKNHYPLYTDQALKIITESKYSKYIKDAYIALGEMVIILEQTGLIKFLEFLKVSQNLRLEMLTSICAADYLDREKRFEVVYQLLSMHHNFRVRIKIYADEESVIPSVVNVFSSAGWFEREIWDLYGVKFSGNPDLRRILTDYGFEGHPMRKDFPLTGHLEVRYDEEKKSVVYEPVHLAQSFRNFDSLNPWHGEQYVLPGDEKAEK